MRANKCQGFWMLPNRGAYAVAGIKMATWLWLRLKLLIFASSTSIFVTTAVFEWEKVSIRRCQFPLSPQQSLVMNS